MMLLTTSQVERYCTRVPAATQNEPMARHTNFRVGGAARLYVIATTADQIVEAVEAAHDLAMPWFVYGGGSNVLVADGGYEGVVIQIAAREISIRGTSVVFESGVITALAARRSVEAGLEGFEWAVGIPGTMGGAIFGDAGCFGGEMRDSIHRVHVYRVRDRARLTLSNTECQFGYRDSLFKHEPYIILGGELVLRMATDPEASRARLTEIMQIRKDKQPLDQSSAGCIFKNVDYANEAELDILRRQVAEIPAAMVEKKRLVAGWLIDQAGMLGKRIGDVEVSTQHGNFFLNKGQARAQDVIALISLVKMKVRDDLGIELQEEVQYLGL